jgi:hypothetical protein
MGSNATARDTIAGTASDSRGEDGIALDVVKSLGTRMRNAVLYCTTCDAGELLRIDANWVPVVQAIRLPSVG